MVVICWVIFSLFAFASLSAALLEILFLVWDWGIGTWFSLRFVFFLMHIKWFSLYSFYFWQKISRYWHGIHHHISNFSHKSLPFSLLFTRIASEPSQALTPSGIGHDEEECKDCLVVGHGFMYLHRFISWIYVYVLIGAVFLVVIAA